MPFSAIRKKLFQAHLRLRLKPGDIYESCSYQPILCLGANYTADEIWGISLIDGSDAHACSLVHCGVRKITPKQAWEIKMRGPLPPQERERFEEGKRWWNTATAANTEVVRLVGPGKPRVRATESPTERIQVNKASARAKK